MLTNWRQSRATEMAEEHVIYKERLRELGLLSLDNAKTKEGSNGIYYLKSFGDREPQRRRRHLSQRHSVKAKREQSVQHSKGNSD